MHEILTRNGVARAIYSQAEGAGWTTLGRAIPAEIAKEPRKMLEYLGAYHVEKASVTLTRSDGMVIEFPERKGLVAVWGDGSVTPLEVVSDSRYFLENRQPLDIFESFRDELAKEGLEISHAAILKNGALISVCARMRDLDRFAQIKGDFGSHEVYASASSGWDRVHGTDYFLTDIRTVCANTHRFGLAQADKAGRRRTRTASQKIESFGELTAMLNGAINRVEADVARLQEMVNVKLSNGEAKEYFAKVLGIPLDKLGVRDASGKKLISTRAENQLSVYQGNFASGPGSDSPAANGTLFGAFQAVTRTVDHDMQVRDTSGQGRQAARFTSATVPGQKGFDLKQKALVTASEMLADLLARPMSISTDTLTDIDGQSEFSRLLASA